MYHALLDYAERHGRRMTLVVPGAENGEERLGRTTRIVRIRAPKSPVADGRYRMLLPQSFLPAGRGPIWRFLADERPDVVEICDKYSLCFLAGLIRLGRHGRRPALVGLSCERMDDNIEAFVRAGAMARTFAREIIGRVYLGMFDVHLANSEYTADELRRAMRAPHLRPVHVCPPGVDLAVSPDHAEVTAARHELLDHCCDQNATLLLYAGRLSPEKHVLLLPAIVAALSREMRVHLVVAGDGPLREQIEKVASRLVPGRVHLLGHLPRPKLRTVLHACDVFVHPNPREPFGIGPLEAMAAGTPVVAPSAGGLLTYATSENAWLSAPHASAMAAAVTACLGDRDERLRRAAAGRLTAEAHSWRNAAQRMFAEYDAAQAVLNPGKVVADAARAPVTHAGTGMGRAPASVPREVAARKWQACGGRGST